MKGDNYPGIPMRGEWRKTKPQPADLSLPLRNMEIEFFFETGLSANREMGYRLFSFSICEGK